MPKIRWLIIWMCFIANAISYIDRANLAIAAPVIRHELGLDAAAMGLVLSAFFWTYAAMQLPAGWIIDRIGVRLSLALAVGWWSLFTMATGFARGISQFIGARLMLGVGEAAQPAVLHQGRLQLVSPPRTRAGLQHLQQRFDRGIGAVDAAGDLADRDGGLARRLHRHRRVWASSGCCSGGSSIAIRSVTAPSPRPRSMRFWRNAPRPSR